MALLTEFTVIDVETTGLYPGGHDRIVEVATVKFSEHRDITDSYATLVNPRRDVGPTHVHGIRARDVVDAPTFEEIAGDVIARIEHVIVAAHNIRFDLGFLAAELARIGYQLPEVPTLCTLHLSHQLPIGGLNRKLGSCCHQLGIPLEGAHCAANDAEATGRLLLAFLDIAERQGITSLAQLGCDADHLASEVWPPLKPSGKCCPRSESSAATGASYIGDLVRRLPPQTGHEANATAYLELLDRALEDRRVTEDEARGLLAVAEEWGISRERVESLHRAYLEDVTQIALEDWHISPSERSDLREVASLLGLTQEYLDASIAAAMIGAPPHRIPGGGEELAGKTVCFTGSFTSELDGEHITRETATRLAETAGMSVVASVTRKLDFLVVADADSQSGKAKKARDFGTRIVAESAFWQMLGVQVE